MKRGGGEQLADKKEIGGVTDWAQCPSIKV